MLSFESADPAGTVLDGLSSLNIATRRVDVVLRTDPADASTERVITVDPEPRLIRLRFLGSAVPLQFALLTVPPGYVAQIRLIEDSISATLHGEEHPIFLPSGEQTGLKVGPDDGVAFEVREGESTGVLVHFDPATQVILPPGRGLLMHPVIRASRAALEDLLPLIPGRLNVRFVDGTYRADAEALIAARGSTVLNRFGPANLYVVTLPEGETLAEALGEYEAESIVDFAMPEMLYFPRWEPGDLLLPDQWGLVWTRTPRAWDHFRGSPSVKVAIIDNGFDLDHPDLVNNIWLNDRELPAACHAPILAGLVDGVDVYCKICDVECRLAAAGHTLNGEPIPLPPYCWRDSRPITFRNMNFWTKEVMDEGNRGILRSAAHDFLLASPAVAIQDLNNNDLIDPLDLLAEPDGVLGDQDGLPCADDSLDPADDDCNGYVDDPVGWDFHGHDPAPEVGAVTANMGHGTAVAGIIGADTDNYEFVDGVPQPLGLAGMVPEVSLVLLKAADPEKEDFVPGSERFAALHYAAKVAHALITVVPHGTMVLSEEAPVLPTGCGGEVWIAPADRFEELRGAALHEVKSAVCSREPQFCLPGDHDFYLPQFDWPLFCRAVLPASGFEPPLFDAVIYGFILFEDEVERGRAEDVPVIRVDEEVDEYTVTITL